MSESRMPNVYVEPAKLHVGDMTFPFDLTPLPVAADEFRSVTCVQVSPDCLELRPTSRRTWGYMITMAAGTLGAAVGLVFLLANHSQVAAVVVALLYLLFLLVCLRQFLAGNCWISLDRSAGRLTIYRRKGLLWKSVVDETCCPLDRIAALQLLDAGEVSWIDQIGETGTPGSIIHHQFRAYQLNVVLAEPPGHRFNLAAHSDLKWMRQVGQQIANHLGRPLVDQIPA